MALKVLILRLACLTYFNILFLELEHFWIVFSQAPEYINPYGISENQRVKDIANHLPLSN